jgi:hypothetical protein
MASQSLSLVVETCLQAANDLPVTRRASLYRALADFCGVPQQSADLQKMAADLEAADRRCQEFAFAFTQQTRGGAR